MATHFLPRATKLQLYSILKLSCLVKLFWQKANARSVRFVFSLRHFPSWFSCNLKTRWCTFIYFKTIYLALVETKYSINLTVKQKNEKFMHLKFSCEVVGKEYSHTHHFCRISRHFAFWLSEYLEISKSLS